MVIFSITDFLYFFTLYSPKFVTKETLMPKETKTNAMRFLEQHKIPYRLYTYICEHFTDGVSVAQQLGQPPERTFKTLITQGRGRGFYVFVIPVAEELDVKKAARTVQEKSLHLLPVKDILSVTGYIRGGCTPIGMKKSYPTYLHESCLNFDTIFVSGGRVGTQIELSPQALLQACGGQTADLTVSSAP